MSTPFIQQPGVTSLAVLNYRSIFTDNSTFVAAAGMYIMDGAESRDTFNANDVNTIQAGTIIGKVTDTNSAYVNLYRPTVIGLTTANVTAGTNSTSVYANAATVTEVARLFTAAGTNTFYLTLVGPPTAGGTVASLTSAACTAASGTTITMASISANLVAKSWVCASDGSAVPVSILANNYGVPMTLGNGTSLNQMFMPYVTAGDIDVTAITCYAGSDKSLQTYIKTKLNAVGTFRFSDNR